MPAEHETVNLCAFQYFMDKVLGYLNYRSARAARLAPDRIAIEAVLADEKRVRGSTSYSGASTSDRRKVREGLGQIDLSKCPESFQSAFRDYIHEWEWEQNSLFSAFEKVIKLAGEYDATVP
jgi:hypothetical protein